MQHQLHQYLALGGTFDHLHLGHQTFIKFAASKSPQLIIGLTDKDIAQSKPYANVVQSFALRKKQLLAFCKDSGFKVDVIPIHDVYGSTLTDSNIDALAVTTETVSGAAQINHQRKLLGLTTLPVYICPLVVDELGDEIHSERIRAGAINREGIVYLHRLKRGIRITAKQKEFIQKLKFPLVSQPDREHLGYTAVVGDQSLKKFIEHNWSYQLAVFDHKIGREVDDSPLVLANTLPVVNPAGQITPQLVGTLEQSIKVSNFKQHILVSGEEDLAAMALALLLPLGSQIYFGQPQAGMACISVTEQVKEQVLTIISG